MAKLTAAARKKLPASDFGGPGRSYPMPDWSHAIFVKEMAARHASPAERAKIDAKANKVLHAHGAGGVDRRRRDFAGRRPKH